MLADFDAGSAPRGSHPGILAAGAVLRAAFGFVEVLEVVDTPPPAGPPPEQPALSWP
jgi:hypothetical protein